MKTLTVYMKDKFEKYPHLFQDFTYEIDGDGILRMIKHIRGEQYKQYEIAVFKNWDYFLIEEGHEI